MGVIDWFVLYSRLLLAIICTDVAINYGIWLRQLRENPPGSRMKSMVAGITLANAGWAARNVVYWHAGVAFWPLFEVATELLVATGVTLHLLPIWTLDKQWNRRRIVSALVFRAGGAAILTAFVGQFFGVRWW